MADLSIKSNPSAETVGTSPKVAWITIALLAIAVVIVLLDKLVLGDDIEDAVWQTAFALALPALLVGRAAPAALQRSKGPAA